MRAKLRLLPTDEGGRSAPLLSGYRSLVRFEGDDQDIGFEWRGDTDPLGPGQTGTGRLEFWALEDESRFPAGHGFEVREGARVVGYGTVIDNKTRSVSFPVPNALILVGDPAGEPPADLGRVLVRASRSCVAVGTLPGGDGKTTVNLTPSRPDGDAFQRVFQGKVEVPSRLVTVASVLNDIYLETPVDEDTVQIEVWANDDVQPDELYVIVSVGQ